MAKLYRLTSYGGSPRPGTYPSKLPFLVHYFYSANDRDTDVARRGHCGSEVGALRSAVVKLAVKQYARVVVHGESGEVLYRATRRGNRIEILGVFIEYADWVAKLERDRVARERLRAQAQK